MRVPPFWSKEGPQKKMDTQKMDIVKWVTVLLRIVSIHVCADVPVVKWIKFFDDVLEAEFQQQATELLHSDSVKSAL